LYKSADETEFKEKDMLLESGVKNITACDEFGILYKERAEGIKDHKKWLCTVTNLDDMRGNLSDALVGADVFIGVSVANILTKNMIKTMADKPIVFAMANPNPEISYDDAIKAGVAIMGTGRSDRPNQINNVLAFPGIFRGALDAHARDINYTMKKAAAKAIAEYIKPEDLNPENIIPSALDKNVAKAVARVVEEAAIESGCNRK